MIDQDDPKALAQFAYDFGWNWRKVYNVSLDEATERNPFKNDHSKYGYLQFRFFLEGFKNCDSYLKIFEHFKNNIK